MYVWACDPLAFRIEEKPHKKQKPHAHQIHKVSQLTTTPS